MTFGEPVTRASSRGRRRHQWGQWLGPALAGLAVLSLGVGLLVGATRESESERAADRFLSSWERRDYAAMHELLTAESKRRHPLDDFRDEYARAEATATVKRLAVTDRTKVDGGSRASVSVSTAVFGVVRGDIVLPIEDDRVAWAPHLVFPGLPPGARLARSTRAPERARILTREGDTLVEGPAAARTSPLGEAGSNIAGTVGPPETKADRRDLYARGFAPGTPIGLTGLERILERQVAGRPGGSLTAAGRVLASSSPAPAAAVRTTIDADVQRAAVGALAGRFGGIAALDARSAEVRGLAGIAFSAPQPPGSTFKIVTTTAALEAGKVKASDRFPVETKAVIDGVDLENANGESCGGTFAESFAHSCNSVFAPLGVRVGATRLVETAERYGFNQRPAIPGAAKSTIPAAREIDSPLAVGSTAIGQGRLLATPLELASMSQTVASEGVRRQPTLLPGHARRRGTRVTSRRVARELERLMIGVVEYGTGTAASLAPVKVAGKTGTAELENEPDDDEPPPGEEAAPRESNTDAWFTAYAPVRRSRIAVGVLFVRAGAGGETAAPAAKLVLQAGLKG